MKPLPLLAVIEPVRHKYPPMLGPLEDVAAGTPEWAERLGLRILHGVERIAEQGVERLIPWIVLAFNTSPHPWQIWPPERPCRTPDGYFQYAANTNCASLSKLVAAYKGDNHPLVRRIQRATAEGEAEIAEEFKPGRPKADENRGDPPDLERGKTVAHLLRRLAREAPAILAAYERGDLKTPTAAARAAGFKVGPTELQKLCRAWRKASPEERRIFLAEIEEKPNGR